jgi:acyl carrier protein
LGRGAEVSDGIDEKVRAVVGSYGGLSVAVDDVDPEDNLYELGMTSAATLNVMLALEEAFDIEFPEELLEREIFGSLSTMDTAISGLVDQRRTA